MPNPKMGEKRNNVADGLKAAFHTYQVISFFEDLQAKWTDFIGGIKKAALFVLVMIPTLGGWLVLSLVWPHVHYALRYLH